MDQGATARRQFAEDFGVLFEEIGVLPMAGRVWGWLLTAAPPQQTAADLADALECSRSSISSATEALMRMGLVERAAVPGQRSRLYQVAPGGFARALRRRMDVTEVLRRMAERGLEIVGDDQHARQLLQEYRDCCVFFERELGALVDRWLEQRAET